MTSPSLTPPPLATMTRSPCSSPGAIDDPRTEQSSSEEWRGRIATDNTGASTEYITKERIMPGGGLGMAFFSLIFSTRD